MRESDYVCPINDRECGDDRGLWCRRCPKRKPKITEAEEFIANLRQQIMKPICVYCHTPIVGSIAAHGDPDKPNTPLLHPECAPYWRRPQITEADIRRIVREELTAVLKPPARN